MPRPKMMIGDETIEVRSSQVKIDENGAAASIVCLTSKGEPLSLVMTRHVLERLNLQANRELKRVPTRVRGRS